MSYITVPAEKVIIACENFLGHAEFMRDITQLNAIKKEAKSKRFWIFGGAIGYEKAFQNIMDGDVFCYMEYRTACWFVNSDNYELASNLKLLAENGNPVKVSDNAAFIFNPKWEADLIKWGIL